MFAALLALVMALHLAPLPAMAETAQDTPHAQGQSEGPSAPDTRTTPGETGDVAGGTETGTGDAAGAAPQTEGKRTEDSTAPSQEPVKQPSEPGSSGDGAASTPTAPSKEDHAAHTPDAPDATINVSVRVIGPDAEGHDVDWLPATNVTVASTATGFDATEAAFKKGGLAYDAVRDTTYGAYLKSITSPYTQQRLGYDASSGAYWSLLVNTGSGLTHSDTGISSIDMSAVREIVWYYSAGTATPAETPNTEPSSSPLPTYTSDWPSFQRILGDQQAATPTDAATVAWDVDLSQYGDGGRWHKVSELLSVNGFIYAAVDDRVVRIDERTGAVDATRGTLDAPISYTSRPLYVNGMIVVALEDGRVEALNAATLKRRWTTPIMAKGYQSSCSLSLTSGSTPQIVVGISQGSGTAGMLLAIDPSTGSLASYRVLDQSQASGWYWSGAASVDGCLVAADTAGRVSVYRTGSGEQVTSYQLASDVPNGAAVNADVVALDDTDFLVATRDGRLHRMRLTDADGTIGIAEAPWRWAARARPHRWWWTVTPSSGARGTRRPVRRRRSMWWTHQRCRCCRRSRRRMDSTCRWALAASPRHRSCRPRPRARSRTSRSTRPPLMPPRERTRRAATSTPTGWATPRRTCSTRRRPTRTSATLLSSATPREASITSMTPVTW